jgi:hypothetical protein
MPVSHAVLICQAVFQYLAKYQSELAANAAFGLWAGRGEDGMTYQQCILEEW